MTKGFMIPLLQFCGAGPSLSNRLSTTSGFEVEAHADAITSAHEGFVYPHIFEVEATLLAANLRRPRATLENNGQMGNPLAALLPAPAFFPASARPVRRRVGPPHWHAATRLSFRSRLSGHSVWVDASALFLRSRMCDEGYLDYIKDDTISKSTLVAQERIAISVGDEERNCSNENVPYDLTRYATRWKIWGLHSSSLYQQIENVGDIFINEGTGQCWPQIFMVLRA
ncbi:hypothetical protein Cgig2_030172 [Carnegiea gigantea]|uniref:Uncharacterized protein n=1 Tax=Carnegiea gigantea TaxID=171969 RepID=A0A9Q1K9N8_9CARY|nr:hypothetical protein Cgig2_030172 [Carnegiea gigantea]